MCWLCYCTDVAQQRGQPNFARCLAISCAGTLYIYFREILPRNRILPGAKFNLRPSLAFSYIGSVTARHSSSGHQSNFAAFGRGHHLYLAGRPSHWASAHILVRHDLFSVLYQLPLVPSFHFLLSGILHCHGTIYTFSLPSITSLWVLVNTL